MGFELLSDSARKNCFSPGTTRDLWDLYEHRKNLEGFLELTEEVSPFFSQSMITGLDVQEDRCPTIGFAGADSLAKTCMADSWVKRSFGQTISDPKLSELAALGYFPATNGHMHTDVVEATADTPAFGKLELTYFRTIIPSQTLTGKRCLLVVCDPIGHLRSLLSPETRYQIAS